LKTFDRGVGRDREEDECDEGEEELFHWGECRGNEGELLGFLECFFGLARFLSGLETLIRRRCLEGCGFS